MAEHSSRGGRGLLGQGGRWAILAAAPQTVSAGGSSGRERPACCLPTQARACRTATLTADDGGGRVQCQGCCHGVVACLAHDAFRGGRHGIVHFQLDVRNAVPAGWDGITPGEKSGPPYHPRAARKFAGRRHGSTQHQRGMLPAANSRKAGCSQGVHNLQAGEWRLCVACHPVQA